MSSILTGSTKTDNFDFDCACASVNLMNIEKSIEEKKKEIDHYEGVLDRYGHGRWRNQGLRHLEDLQEQLRKLQEEASN